MNQKLQNIMEIIQQSEKLDAEQKDNLLKAVKDADKELEITAFKLERTEKVKKTTAILLEETIEELEQKRKAVEKQNRELEIESSLERVRAVAMGMDKSVDLLKICEVSFKEFKKLGFDNLRNAIINILNDEKRFFMDYDYSDYLGGSINKISYDSHPIIENYLKQIKKADDAFAEVIVEGSELDGWKDFRRRGGQRDDPKLDNIPALYYYLYSIGVGDIGISTFSSIDESKIKILKRFRNVFDLAYRRYNDITLAEAQARETQIELALERVRARTMGMQKSEELKEVIRVVYEQFVHLNIHIEHTGFIVDYKARDDMHIWLADKNEIPSEITIPCFDSPPNNSFKEAKVKGQDFFAYLLTFEEKNKFYRDLFKFIPGVPEESLEYYINCPGLAGSGVLLDNVGLYIENFSGTPYTDEENAVLMRFGKVFQQTYTRFLDLQKAEAQARESQIQLGLERVRARAMAMHKSDELLDAGELLYKELSKLGIVSLSSGYVLMDKEEKIGWNYGVNPSDGKIMPIAVGIPHTETVVMQSITASWKSQEPFFVIELNPEETIKHQTFIAERSINFPISASQLIAISPERLVLHTFNFKQGYLLIVGGVLLNPEQLEMVVRFTKVFEMTYRRFLDLQKAETQAREAQIEAALERVRARSMSMHKSNELKDVVRLLYKEFRILVTDIHSVNIQLNLDSSKDIHYWASVEEDIYPELYHVPYSELPIFEKFYNAFNSPGDGFLDYLLNKEEKDAFFSEVFKIQPVPPQRKKMIQNAEGMVMMGWFYKYSGIDILRYNLKHFSEEEKDIVKRFAAAFEQTYIRFLDLQKAEAQAREAKIEASLERVRSRTMAMHKSEELLDVITVVSEQLKHLDFRFDHVSFAVNNQVHDYNFWISFFDHPHPQNIFVPYLDNPMFERAKKAQQEGLPFYSDVLTPEENKQWHKHVFTHNDFDFVNEKLKHYIYKSGFARSVSFLPHIMLIIGNYRSQPYSKEENKIISRFATVFEQSYTRFLDLQKAEAQAREAKIEASLEKVRTVALTMKKSDEMLDIAEVLYKQLLELGFTNIRNTIIDIHNDINETFLDYDYSDDMGRTVTLMSYYDHPIIEKQVRQIQSSSDAFFELILEGQDLQYLIDIRLKNGEAEDPRLRQIEQLTYNLYSFGSGAIGISNFGLLSDGQKIILKRFRNVFAFAYKRYTDMVQAEAQAREAIKQASLDRVRGEIASMRTSEDLNRITPIIWRELKTLEVPFIRCGVFIVNEDKGNVQVYLTTPDGKSLAALNLSFDANELTLQTVEHWKRKQVYKEHWNKEEFINWTKSMMKLGQVQNAETYQGSSTPPESLHLHFVPFAQGMLYVGDVSPLTDEKLDLVKTLAEAFSIAYARYEDFKNLEEAKNKIEITLKELKATQAQLIHSEKMASLGELTAGIAHEIKNPLNFVNNFSEVSRDLLDDMKVEIEKNNLEEVIEIVEDLKNNLEKINQHGRRADSIIKGMLLHSRGSSGEKTLTDINDLLEQYVTLAYHGMRATNKEFNITIEKEYDKSLEKINVVPQDISRVFLNIINNACYAAYDKKKKNRDSIFSPKLSVSTKNLNGKIEIRIGDNGNGIPANILDKIFQPFFTTKPTGEGTGLGLSLSYDIVTKVHEGELKMETKEGEGSLFKIILPVN